MPLAFAGCEAHSFLMDDDLLSFPVDDDLLTVRTRQHAAGFAWELYRASKAAAVKFSVPIYGSEEAARIAGVEARRLHLGALAKKRKLPNG
jgi:hypothetical protein